MAAYILMIASFCMPAVFLLDNPTDLQAIKKAAQALATATKNGDAAGLLEGTYPKAVEMMGGKDVAEKKLNSEMGDWKKKGISITKAECSDPMEIQKIDGKLYAVVPMVLEMKLPNGVVISPSYLLGISEDGGKVWKFIDGSGLNKKKESEALLPGIYTKLKLPAKQERKFIPNP